MYFVKVHDLGVSDSMRASFKSVKFMSQAFTFSDIADVFVREGFLLSPAECHGWGCGILAAGYRLQPEQWQQQLTDFAGENPSRVIADVLLAFYELSLQQMEEGFGLVLLLPEDEYPLAQRSEMLGDWCGGFLHGFATLQAEASREIREILEDFAAIAQIDASDAGSNAPESDYTHLVEYVRMAVITLFLEFNQPGGSVRERH
ncbi:MAG: UPF0149 family protein [Pseudomonadales bacterium]|nr:UPF0149 family protein [Pseudomonadales bacterium]